MSTGEVLIDLAHVAVRFGAVTALHESNVQLRQGEFVALVGANGSGKTTLLHALHGLVPHSGARRVAAAGMGQAMVFQRPFVLRLSVWNNLRVGLWLAGVARAERRARAEESLRHTGLIELRDRPARTLSGGQQQRLALARAWAVRPAVLLLDEPTANLDPSAKHAIEAMLERFKADGTTIVMSTHNLGQAKRLATRVIHIDRGVIHSDLPTASFFGQQVDARTELFLKGGEMTWTLD
ncbi:MAG TPA: ATP-binding cassette domain-containing protein [Burkholderiaceae bacterium]|nr:ATP-binding cassette domain-containing protein [Burkholderiaceae bacterium]